MKMKTKLAIFMTTTNWFNFCY